MPDITNTISGNFLAKGLRHTFYPAEEVPSCEHEHPHHRQNIEYVLYFCKKVSENLRMCNFCCTFAT